MSNSHPDDSDAISVTVINTLARVEPGDWDACANPDPTRYNPFLSHAFLSTLEKSGCVGLEKGWIPQHLILRDSNEEISGVMPCYVKTHSRGEYVFDDAWAHAMENAGGTYYPKLQCAVPFTPVPGRRILAKPGPQERHVARILMAAAIELASKLDLSSVHLTFIDEHQLAPLDELGILTRTDQQFHWHNHGYQSFDDFLDALSSRKRKTLRKERAKVVDAGIEFEHLHGPQITAEHWDKFYEFYLDTGDRKWGEPYLNLEFFKLLGKTMANQCLLMMAKRDGDYIAGALHIIGGDCLYGRYWGSSERVPYLHFELCYYRAIEYAIENGLARVEAGAQGDHKLVRGYVPTTTYSAHWIRDAGLRAAVAKYLERERNHVARMHGMLSDFAPYKKSNSPRPK